MKIKDVIEKYYDEFSGMVRNPDKIIEGGGRTSADILQDVCITAMNKYKNKDVDEEEAYNYIRKTLCTEWLFAPKRKDIILYTDGLWDIIDDDTLSA